MDSWPNQEALNKALNIYRVSMRSFIIFHLKKIPGMNVEDVVIDSVGDWRADEIDRILSESGRDIGSVIDINDFPHLVNKNWVETFEKILNDDKTFRNQLWLIVECRNADWAHPPEGDAEFESTRAHLFLIADILGKINKSEAKNRVEVIRDELDDTAERLAEAEERLKNVEAENAEYKKSLLETEERLTDAESRNSKYEKDTAELSKQVDEKENRIKKLLKQQKETKAQNEKSKKDVAAVKKRLDKSEAAQTDYKQRLETISKKLKVTEKEARTSEENLKTTSNQLNEAIDEWMASVECLTATRKLFTAATIGSQEIQKMFPSFETNSAVRILDRRNTEKKNYLLNLLEQKQPTIIYVQSEDKIHQLLTLVGPEKAAVIGRHSEQTSETEATEILKKLENSELIAVVSNTTFSELQRSDCVEHFVFCHLVPSVDEFFKRCQPAFASEKDSYLHLIYNDEQDAKNLDEWLTQKYPDRETLNNLYRALRECVGINGDFIKTQKVYNELDIAGLGVTELGIETGLAIFEELQLVEKSGESIKLLSPAGKKLDESKIHHRGEELKDEIEEIRSFQLKQPIEKIWEEILGALDIDSQQMLRENSIYKTSAKSSEIENHTRRTLGTEENKIDLPTLDVWPQRSPSSFDSLRQRAAKVTHDTDRDRINDSYSVIRSPFGDMENEEDYQNKYDLAMQFAQEHGVSALEEGITELIKDQDDPNYDFTEDERNILFAFQDALRDFQTQSGQSTEVFEKDNAASDATLEARHTPKPARANAKVTEAQVREIRSRSAAGESYSKLAREFGLTPTGIRNIVLRNTWKHVE